MTTLVATFAGVGLLLIALAVPLVRRKVPPNGWYGVRVAATFADDWVWYEANARSGRDLLIIGVAQVALAVLLALVAVPEYVYTLVNVTVLLVGAVVFAAVGIRRANRLLMDRRGSGAAA